MLLRVRAGSQYMSAVRTSPVLTAVLFSNAANSTLDLLVMSIRGRSITFPWHRFPWWSSLCCNELYNHPNRFARLPDRFVQLLSKKDSVKFIKNRLVKSFANAIGLGTSRFCLWMMPVIKLKPGGQIIMSTGLTVLWVTEHPMILQE